MPSRNRLRSELIQGIEEPTPALHTDTTDPLHDSPGRQLRVARETAQVSLKDVAHELHLSTATIEALEDDHYDGLPSEVFVVGYLRAYARLLGLDPAPLLDQYRRLQPAGSRPVLPLERKREAESRSFVLPLIIVLLVLVLGGGIWFAWTQLGGSAFFGNLFVQSESEETQAMPLGGRVPQPVLPRPPADSDEAGTTAGTNEAADGDPAAAQDAAEVSEAEGDAAASGAESGAGQNSAPADGNPQSAAPSDQDAGTAPGDQGSENASTIAGAGEEDNPAENDSADATNRPGEAAPSGTAEVVMTFNGPCWVDVRDATGEFKLFGEMNKGDREVLGGRAPYSIILGNATAVAVTIDGKPFDVQTVARGNVARFDLDPAAL
ncbi:MULTISPECIES: RodZ domain-containing protein [Thiorhodovibrio]|uniref:RodZ domain-containing protein n=1 Tax=Thiorhodovibrio TaxID=61593 RepID=UPI001A91E081|nr:MULTISPECIES: RodZ domain-containing protein [Thiorhodovibrio]MBK5967826.1 hypothetical protein [Thiorhodovibrio winogradskyi]WPL14368.1 Cytoskeleton protein RodZ [Thiorhodovibrio litoralis]